MIEFRFFRIPDQEPPYGFDLGHMEIIGRFGRISSWEQERDQSMMIFVAVADLLYGIQTLIESTQGLYNFVGTDSSFQLNFIMKKGRIRTSVDRKKVDESDASDVAVAVWRAAQNLVSQELHTLPEDDAARRDLVGAISKFSILVERGADS